MEPKEEADQHPEKASQKTQIETGRAPDDGVLTDWPPATSQMNPRAEPDHGETVYVKISSVDSYTQPATGQNQRGRFEISATGNFNNIRSTFFCYEKSLSFPG